jgi:hypothetical protein
MVLELLYSLANHNAKHRVMAAREGLLECSARILAQGSALFLQHAVNLKALQAKYRDLAVREVTQPIPYPLSKEHEQYMQIMATVLRVPINIFFKRGPDLLSFSPLYYKCVSFQPQPDPSKYSSQPLPDLMGETIDLSFADGGFGVLDRRMSNYVRNPDFHKIVKDSMRESA